MTLSDACDRWVSRRMRLMSVEMPDHSRTYSQDDTQDELGDQFITTLVGLDGVGGKKSHDFAMQLMKPSVISERPMRTKLPALTVSEKQL